MLSIFPFREIYLNTLSCYYGEGALHIMTESRKSTKKVAENRKKETDSAENRKREVVETRKTEEKATETRKRTPCNPSMVDQSHHPSERI